MLDSFATLIRNPYFDTYLNHLETDDMQEALTSSAQFLIDMISPLSEQQMEYKYAPGKWSIREVVLHTIETELIFNYRALRIAREKAPQNLDGFDENAYVEESVVRMSKEEVFAYFDATRKATLSMINTFSDDQMKKTGVASGHEIQVEALFFIQSGHTLHHAKVIRDRYIATISAG